MKLSRACVMICMFYLVLLVWNVVSLVIFLSYFVVVMNLICFSTVAMCRCY